MMIKRILKYTVPSSNVSRKLSSLCETDINQNNTKAVFKESILSRKLSSLCETDINQNNTKAVFKEQVETTKDGLSVTNTSVLEELNEDISHVSPYLKPTFNFAAYVNKSATLQELLKLGVDLHKIERNVEAVPFILGLKFENIKEHIIFFKNLGLETESIGNVISKNPLVLKEDLENLKVRINYLRYKKFTEDMVLRIVDKNPQWLSFSTQEIDERLGFFQNHFVLTGDEVRLITVKAPKLITFPIHKIKLNSFVLKEEMGFSQEEIKQIILSKPSMLYRGQNKILKTFEFLHKTMNIPLEKILQTPEILTCRHKRLMERHLFLEKMERAQYDSKKPNYVALTTLVAGSDSHFSTEIAKSSVQIYNAFLKSL